MCPPTPSMQDFSIISSFLKSRRKPPLEYYQWHSSQKTCKSLYRISIAETTTEENVCAVEFCSQGLMGEGWENILLPTGLLCGFCWSLNIFHSPYFRPPLGMSGNQTALYLYLICHGLRKKRKKRNCCSSHIFLPWLFAHLLAVMICFLTKKHP